MAALRRPRAAGEGERRQRWRTREEAIAIQSGGDGALTLSQASAVRTTEGPGLGGLARASSVLRAHLDGRAFRGILPVFLGLVSIGRY